MNLQCCLGNSTESPDSAGCSAAPDATSPTNATPTSSCPFTKRNSDVGDLGLAGPKQKKYLLYFSSHLF